MSFPVLSEAIRCTVIFLEHNDNIHIIIHGNNGNSKKYLFCEHDSSFRYQMTGQNIKFSVKAQKFPSLL